MLDYSLIILQISQLMGYCFPFVLIFGISAKLFNMAVDMIFGRKIEI